MKTDVIGFVPGFLLFLLLYTKKQAKYRSGISKTSCFVLIRLQSHIYDHSIKRMEPPSNERKRFPQWIHKSEEILMAFYEQTYEQLSLKQTYIVLRRSGKEIIDM